MSDREKYELDKDDMWRFHKLLFLFDTDGVSMANFFFRFNGFGAAIFFPHAWESFVGGAYDNAILTRADLDAFAKAVDDVLAVDEDDAEAAILLYLARRNKARPTDEVLGKMGGGVRELFGERTEG